MPAQPAHTHKNNVYHLKPQPDLPARAPCDTCPINCVSREHECYLHELEQLQAYARNGYPHVQEYTRTRACFS